MAQIIFPRDLLVFVKFRHYLEDQEQGGGMNQFGDEQVVASPGIKWRASGSLIVCERNKNILAYEGFVSAMEGRLNTTFLPVGTGRSPNQLAGIDDGQQHTLNERVDMNKTSIRINNIPGRVVQIGQKFSFPNGRCHRITRVISNNIDSTQVKISPWTHVDYPANTLLEFDNPVCEMRFSSDNAPSPELEFNRYATPTMSFVEA